MVAYTRQTSALRSTVDTLLDAASYGTRWVLLCPAPQQPPVWPGSFCPGPLDPEFEFGLWLVTAPGPGPSRAGQGRRDQRSFALRMVCVRWSP